MSVWGDTKAINGFGLFCVSAAAIFAALRWVFTGKLLSHSEEKYNPVWIVYQLAPPMGAFTLAASLILEDWIHISSYNGFHDMREAAATLSITSAIGGLTTLMLLSEYVLAQITS